MSKPTTKPVALRQRFFRHTAWLVLGVMLLSSIVIELSFKQEQEQALRQQLKLHIFTLLSVAEVSPDKNNKAQLKLPNILHNPKFNTLESGLFAAVYRPDGTVLWHSLSVEQVPAHKPFNEQAGSWLFADNQFQNLTYLSARYSIIWQLGEQQIPLVFVVYDDKSSLEKQIFTFRLWLAIGFILITLSLLLTQYWVLNLAFKPIASLEQEIKLLEQGQAEQLSDNYPQELAGVSQNLNSLIHKEQLQRERYRNSMADMAHSLKTPIAIIRNEMLNYANNHSMQQALSRMNDSIEYQLRRSVISGHQTISQGSEIQVVLALLLQALEKVYIDKKVDIDIDLSQAKYFYGDENDLMEVLGNILDNAFKHCSNTIEICAWQTATELFISIADNGPGLSNDAANNMASVFSRGERLDSKETGQGLGLAIVADIMNSYHGYAKAENNSDTGAKFTLCFAQKDRQDA